MNYDHNFASLTLSCHLLVTKRTMLWNVKSPNLDRIQSTCIVCRDPSHYYFKYLVPTNRITWYFNWCKSSHFRVAICTKCWATGQRWQCSGGGGGCGGGRRWWWLVMVASIWETWTTDTTTPRHAPIHAPAVQHTLLSVRTPATTP